ncbi:MAG: hypothetical protein AAFY57_20475 [Cyanobacteria bacterium J06642_2]
MHKDRTRVFTISAISALGSAVKALNVRDRAADCNAARVTDCLEILVIFTSAVNKDGQDSVPK